MNLLDISSIVKDSRLTSFESFSCNEFGDKFTAITYNLPHGKFLVGFTESSWNDSIIVEAEIIEDKELAESTANAICQAHSQKEYDYSLSWQELNYKLEVIEELQKSLFESRIELAECYPFRKMQKKLAKSALRKVQSLRAERINLINEFNSIRVYNLANAEFPEIEAKQ